MSGFSVIDTVGVSPKTTLSSQERWRLEEAGADFEAVFLKQMLTSMRKTIPKSQEGEVGLIKESGGEKIFRDLLDGEYAKMMSRKGRGFGLKAFVLGQMPAYSETKNVPENIPENIPNRP